MTANLAVNPLLVRHAEAMAILGIGKSKYWAWIRSGRLKTVGEGRMARCYYPSIRALVDEMLAEAADRVAPPPVFPRYARVPLKTADAQE
jgi:hypothetical protein